MRSWTVRSVGLVCCLALASAAAAEESSIALRLVESPKADEAPPATVAPAEAAPQQPAPATAAPAAEEQNASKEQPAAGSEADAAPGIAAAGERAVQSTVPQVRRPAIAPAGKVEAAAAAVPAKKAEPLKPMPAPGSTPVDVEAASFKGVVPGQTSTAALEKAWGKPKQVKHQGRSEQYLYSVEPFNRVEVVCQEGKVSSLIVWLEKSFPVNAVAGQLGLAEIRPVLVSNELGEVLGQSYPERGVFLAFEPAAEAGKSTGKVSQIILESLSAEAFVLRAETNMETQPALSLADLDQAVALQPKAARAHWLRAKLLLTTGETDKALGAADEAVRLDAENGSYLVTRAQILGQLGRFENALADARKAAEQSDRRPHVKARALCLQGDLAAAAPTPDFKQAIALHTEAIGIADGLATDKHPAIRIAAKEVLLDAHLGAAHDIGWGAWKEKAKAIARWTERATEVAEDLVQTEGASGSLRLRVSARVLSASVGARGEIDPSAFAEDAVKTGEALLKGTNDPAQQAQLRWELGLALYDALQVFQIRGDHDAAMKYGERAIGYLEQAGRDTPAAEYLLGRLCFRMGAVYALRDQDHAKAAEWFAKALPLLDKPLPAEAAADLGRHGETFVSMGVSYWESGKQQLALELTEKGVALMERAVRQTILDEAALGIAYGNLASMHRALGEDDAARRLDGMAARIKQTQQR